jgi:hypothetical protein
MHAKKFPGTWETKASNKASWHLTKRKQQKKFPGTWETGAAEKASWGLTKQKKSSRKNFLGPGKGGSRKSFLGPGKRLIGKKRKRDKLLMMTLDVQHFSFINIFQGYLLHIFYTCMQSVYYTEILSRCILINFKICKELIVVKLVEIFFPYNNGNLTGNSSKYLCHC